MVMTAVGADWPSAYMVPDHAYIPGQNARHAEDAFDGIKATAQDGMQLEELFQSAACAHGLAYLEHGYYWEAHEVLEQLWMVLYDAPHQRRVVQALIQIANGLLKLKMRQPKAALRLHQIASDLLNAPLTSVAADTDPSDTAPSESVSTEPDMANSPQADKFTDLIPHINDTWLHQLSLNIKHYNAKLT